jgi:hypothetical protein
MEQRVFTAAFSNNKYFHLRLFCENSGGWARRLGES